MISDVFHDAGVAVDHYLGDRFYDDWYSGALRERILRVRAEMDAIREELDSSRPPTEPAGTTQH